MCVRGSTNPPVSSADVRLARRRLRPSSLVLLLVPFVLLFTAQPAATILRFVWDVVSPLRSLGYVTYHLHVFILQAAGLTALEAKSIGIAVDYRRANKSSESINVNAQRLKFYKANLVVYPRKSKAVAAHRKEEPKLPAPVQRTEPVAFKTAPKRDRPTKITAEMKAVSGFKTFRSERMKIRKLGLAASKAHAEATGRK